MRTSGIAATARCTPVILPAVSARAYVSRVKVAVVAPTGIRLRTLASSWWIPASVALAFATWPFESVKASPGTDHSWQLGLHLAASHGLSFGHDIVYTYGPLGFLLQPVLIGGATGTASVLVTLAAHIALCALLLRGALRSVSPPFAIAIVYAITGVLASIGYALVVSDYLVFFVLFLAVWILEREERAPAAFVVVGAVAAAVQLLVKLNGGVVCFLMLAVAVWRCRPGGARSLGLFAASYAAAVTALWLATGSSLTDLPNWIRLSSHLVTAYAGALALEAAGHSGQYLAAGFATALAAAAFALRLHAQQRARAISLTVLLLVYGFGYWKEGFVRHDVHGVAFFAAVAIALLAFNWSGRTRLVAAAALVVALTASARAPEFAASTVPFHPLRSMAAAGTALGQSVLPGPRNRAIAAGRAAIEDRLALDRDVLAELRGYTVDVGPYETSAVWAYGLHWRPELLLQQYAAEDAVLDSANADALAARGAARLLRQDLWPALDSKHPLYEAPATFMTIVCRYRELSSNGSWSVFARSANRCGTPRLLGSTSAGGGQAVAIPSAPRAGDIVVARIHVRDTVAQRLEQLVLKRRHQPTLVVDNEPYRLVAATATGPLILRMPAAAGISASEGGAVDYSSLSVAGVPSYRIDFYAVPLTRAWRGPAALRGDLTATTVTAGTEHARVVRGAVAGNVETITKSGGAAVISGWAADVDADVPAERVAVFSHGRLLGWVHPSITRFDVTARYKEQGIFYSGFSVLVPAKDSASLTVVALSRGRASVLPGIVQP